MSASAKKRCGITPKIDPSILEPEIILKESKETLIIVEKPFDKKHGSHCFVLKVNYTALRMNIRCNGKKWFIFQIYSRFQKSRIKGQLNAQRKFNENICALLINLDLDQKVSSKLDVEWEVAFDCSRKIPINPKQTTWTLLNKEVKGDFLKIFANFN